MPKNASISSGFLPASSARSSGLRSLAANADWIASGIPEDVAGAGEVDGAGDAVEGGGGASAGGAEDAQPSAQRTVTNRSARRFRMTSARYHSKSRASPRAIAPQSGTSD